MALAIPKMVVLQNDALTRLYYFLKFMTAFLMCAWFGYSGGYMSAVSLRESVHLNMWVNEPSNEELDAELQARMGDVCGSTWQYDYWYDDHWKYNGSTCLRVYDDCNPYNPECMRTADTYAKEDPRRIFFATYSSKRMQGPTGGQKLGRFLTPQVGVFTVNFEYFFTAPYLPMIETDISNSRRPPAVEERLTNKDVMTVFLDANRDVAWVAKPGEALEVPVTTLLDLAGYKDHLTTPHPAWGANAFPNATHPEGPIGLIGGLPLELFIHCFKSPTGDLGEGNRDWTGPTCEVVVNAQEVWSTKYSTDYLGTEGVVDHAQSGIRVTGDMDGTWEYFDVNNCILNFTALLVLMSIPDSIIIFVTCRGLGHLSKIYRRVAFEKFYIGEQIAGMTARMVSHGASFREVEQSDVHGGLTVNGLYDTLSHVTRFRTKGADIPGHADSSGDLEEVFGRRASQISLNSEDDVLLFANYAFDAICDPKKFDAESIPWFLRKVASTRLWRFMDHFLDLLGVVELPDDDGSPLRADSRICVDHFLSAAASSEPAGFEDLLWLFNKNRRTGLVERYFTPKAISEHINPEMRVSLLRQSTVMDADAGASNEEGSEGDDDPPGVDDDRTESEKNEVFDLVTDMTNNCRLSNRALIKTHAQGTKDVIGEILQNQARLAEDLRLMQEACGMVIAVSGRSSTASRDGHRLSELELPGRDITRLSTLGDGKVALDVPGMREAPELKDAADYLTTTEGRLPPAPQAIKDSGFTQRQTYGLDEPADDHGPRLCRPLDSRRPLSAQPLQLVPLAPASLSDPPRQFASPAPTGASGSTGSGTAPLQCNEDCPAELQRLNNSLERTITELPAGDDQAHGLNGKIDYLFL